MPRPPIRAVIFDADGVLLDSPHEQAWRAALEGYADPARFTSAFYQQQVAGKPRLDGALAALQALGVAEAARLAPEYAERKQAMVERLIAEGAFAAYADAVRLVRALREHGFRLAVASSSKNANAMLSKLGLAALFDADLSGRALAHGKPAPDIFLLAAAALEVPPEHCLVVEDAPAGILAARAGGMASLGVARHGDETLLQAAGADLVSNDLDDLDLEALTGGVVKKSGARIPEPPDDPAWMLRVDGVEARREPGLEARLAVGNGFLGVRGARAVSRAATWLSWLPTLSWASWPRCYVAGLFDAPNIDPPVPALVPVADWLRVRITLDGEPLLLRRGQLLAHRRTLDLRRGVLLTEWRQRTPSGVTARLRALRLVSQVERAAGLQLLTLELDRDGVAVMLEASCDAAGLGLRPELLEQALCAWRTEGNGKGVALAVEARLDGAPPQETATPLRWAWRWRSAAGRQVGFERLVALARAEPGEDAAPAARAALERARKQGAAALLQAHEAAWAQRWSCSDVEVEGDPAIQQALRFAVYHLTSVANPDDEQVSIGARGLTGDGYLGHVFWDTEIYLLPFYVATWPQAARALLMYRFHRLPAARAKAAQEGRRGACYAWESADTGDEVTPEQVIGPDGWPVQVLTGRQEQHITADVAYAVWQYWRTTRDDDFLLQAGAEILLETARFWASRAEPGPEGRFHIRGVIGPDEYHENIDDNAFTNVMARWNIARGLEVLEILHARWPGAGDALIARLQIDEAERADWRRVMNGLVDGFDAESGLIEQFAGFHALEPVDVTALADRRAPLDVVLGRARTQRSQVVKQADVVALLGLLPRQYSRKVTALNFRHYAAICGHGSSLSRAMHAMVAARIGEARTALRYLRGSAAIDLAETAEGSAAGVHIAALGGLWQAVVFGFGGLTLDEDTPGLAPTLPPGWSALRFAVQWRGRRLRVAITGEGTELRLEDGEALTLTVHGAQHALRPGDVVRVAANKKGKASS